MPWMHAHFWVLPLLIFGILAVLTVFVAGTSLREIYHRKFPNARRERLFLSSLGFFVTVLVIRSITLAIHYNIGPFHDVSMKGRHIHHLVWGILLLLIVGYGWSLGAGATDGHWSRWSARMLAMIYGIGAALTLDEFALWLNLRDVYWAREGHESLEAMALFGALLALGIFGLPFFKSAGNQILNKPAS
jgi:hypothetical protein